MLRPAEDVACYRAEMAGWPGPEPRAWERRGADWLEANDGCRREILATLYDEGPLPRSELPDTTVVPWESSGWNNDRSRGERRLRALGRARQKAAEAPSEPNDVGETGEPCAVEGVRGTWRVDPAYLDGELEPRAALLSPAGPAGLRPQEDDRALRVGLPAGDVQAGGEAALGLLGDAGPCTATGSSASSTPPPTGTGGCSW